MKIRIRGNSVRLRLLKGEVTALGETGKVSEQTRFGFSTDEILTYTLQSSAGADKISAEFVQNEIRITLPESTAKNWVGTEEVSLEGEHQWGDDKLKILVEKDFACLTRKDDPDNLDAFPNPEDEC